MAINTGEDEQGLRKIMDMTRMISVGLLLLHSYSFFSQVFQTWHWTAPIGERLIQQLPKGKGYRPGFSDAFPNGGQGEKGRTI